jgi:hypothetical protein
MRETRHQKHRRFIAENRETAKRMDFERRGLRPPPLVSKPKRRKVADLPFVRLDEDHYFTARLISKIRGMEMSDWISSLVMEAASKED